MLVGWTEEEKEEGVVEVEDGMVVEEEPGSLSLSSVVDAAILNGLANMASTAARTVTESETKLPLPVPLLESFEIKTLAVAH